MTRAELDKLEMLKQDEAMKEADAALDHVDQIEGVLLRRPSQTQQPEQQQHQMIHTAKAERRLREKMEREGGDEAMEEDELSPAEKRALDAERRAAWRKARLKSLENVISHILNKL